MRREGDEIDVDEVEARGGNWGRFAFKILLLSLTLLLIAYGAILMVGYNRAPAPATVEATGAP